MRLLTVLLQCCALLQYAAAKDAYLYTFNDEHQSASTAPTAISADTAVQIAARRQGFTDQLSLQGVEEATLSQISQHGGYQRPLFSEAVQAEPARVLVRIQAQSTEVRSDAEINPTFKIHNPTKDLLIPGSQSPDGKNYTVGFSSREGVKLIYRIHDETPLLDSRRRLFVSNNKDITEILALTRAYLTEAKSIVSASIDIDLSSAKVKEVAIASEIDLFLAVLDISRSTLNYQPTLIILPPTSQLAPSTMTITKRQDPEEEPLDPTTPALSSTELPATLYASNHTLPKRFPTCFTSKSSCMNTTNFCSGHGTCAASGSNKNCFQCKCTRTVIRTNKDGSKKTNLWAGAACQKKDISFEFVLFATIGVTAMMLVAGVVGMMYSMGAQELPSVIGAGVAGPTARK